MSLNKVQIIGNVGRDPEVRYTASGQTVAQFSVAATRAWKDAGGAWQEETEWFRVVAWGELGNRCGERLRKGSKVYVEGRLATREWEKDGQKRATTEVIAQSVLPLDPRPKGDGSADLTGDARRVFADALPGSDDDNDLGSLPF